MSPEAGFVVFSIRLFYIVLLALTRGIKMGEFLFVQAREVSRSSVGPTPRARGAAWRRACEGPVSFVIHVGNLLEH